MSFESQDKYADYSQVPVIRRRWFFALTVLFFIPLGIVLAFSGDMYAYRGGQVVKFPRSLRIRLAVLWLIIIAFGIMRIAGI